MRFFRNSQADKPNSVKMIRMSYLIRVLCGQFSAANKAREAFNQMEQRVRDIGREIRQIEESSSKDYGIEEEFQALQGQCFDYSDREYTYRLCPFDNGSQRPKHGGSETRLGSWGSWSGPTEDKYSQMHYDKGVQCWNGPQRTLQVI